MTLSWRWFVIYFIGGPKIIQSLDTFTEENIQTWPLPGLLYPRESETREIKSLDGFWDFFKPNRTDPLQGDREKWYLTDLRKIGNTIGMPVPSSYNDITTSSELRDHVGPVWYQRKFFVSPSWRDKSVFVRFGSVNYFAQVWINDKLATSHEIGHLPFETDITKLLNYNKENRITVSVDNSLYQTSIPQGKIIEVTTDNGTSNLQTYTFDFFNYAGIHRPVLLHSKPRVYIEDVTVQTDLTNDTGYVMFIIKPNGSKNGDTITYEVNVYDGNNETMPDTKQIFHHTGIIKIINVKPWWPRGMDKTPGYLYTLEMKLLINDTVMDIYRLPIGIRSLKWTNTKFLINDRAIYMRGFGRHEDSAIRGRGLDLVTIARDHELLEWIGANSYRTSHYPYSDEVIDVADRLGFLIIGECPSVDTENFSPILLKHHKHSLAELIRRDKNHPSVVMWSLANEPRTQSQEAEEYFKEIAGFTKTIDSSRPVTIALARGVDEDRTGQFLDIISFNRYNSWYSNTGRLDMITDRVQNEAEAWHKKYNKPVIMSEYGADTMPGQHELPAYVWSEEYQTEMFVKHFQAFDRLRAKGYFIGEFIWNFADFRTAQTITRVGGNRKGVFTRDRQPKMVARLIRKRYHTLGKELDNSPIPADLIYSI